MSEQKTQDTRQILQEINQLQRQLDALRGRVAGSSRLEPIPQGEISLLRCVVGHETIALLLDEVEEVVMYCATTKIPEAPPWVQGLLSLRGKLVPVIDVLGRITMEARTPALNDFIVICSVRGRKVGLIVQDVLDLVSDQFDVENPQADDTPLAQYLLGVVQIAGEPVFMFSVVSLVESSGLEGVLT